MSRLAPLLSMLRLALQERLAQPGRERVPEPMVMDDPAGALAFHESAHAVQLPVHEVNASMMSRLLPRGGTVLDLGSGSGQLAAHLASGRSDVAVTCVGLSEEMLRLGRAMAADATMPAFFDTFTTSGHDRLRVDAVASEAAAWSLEEMRAMVSEAALGGLQCSRSRLLGVYQAWWVGGPRTDQPPPWVRPPMPDDAGYWADRTVSDMDNLPAA